MFFKRLLFLLSGHIFMSVLICNPMYFSSTTFCLQNKYIVLIILAVTALFYFLAREDIFRGRRDSIFKYISHLFAIGSGYFPFPIISVCLFGIAAAFSYQRKPGSGQAKRWWVRVMWWSAHAHMPGRSKISYPLFFQQSGDECGIEICLTRWGMSWQDSYGCGLKLRTTTWENCMRISMPTDFQDIAVLGSKFLI